MVRRTKEEAQETRNSILDAAERVFFEKGVSRTSLADIAQAAGANASVDETAASVMVGSMRLCIVSILRCRMHTEHTDSTKGAPSMTARK